MTRKDFQLIAEAIAEAVNDSEEYGQLNMAQIISQSFMYRLKIVNDRFDRIRFENAIDKLIVNDAEKINPKE